jgi:hypothetical protein
MTRYQRECARPLARVLLSTFVCAAAVGLAPPASGSSHREAPLITTMPKVDGTDFYVFRSYEPGRDAYVTFVANYIPLQDGYGGPNFFQMDPDAVYMIHISNDGSGNPNLTFRFAFQNTNLDTKLPVGGKQVSIPLVINGGPINGRFPAGINVRETYNISLATATGEQAVTMAGSGAEYFDKPIDNVGMKSIPDYESYAQQHIYTISIPGCTGTGRVFVGQRKDSFVVNLGQTFDLVNIAKPATEFDPDAEKLGKDDLEDKNVTTIALEVPIACVTTSASPIIGAWTTAAVRQTKTFNASPSSGIYAGASSSGNFVQVSRLSAPLVNELVIGLKDKDKFNASRPVDDAANFADYVTNPTLPALLEILFGGVGVRAPTNFPRNDLVAAFLTGVDGLNKPPAVVPAEMMRLNTSIAPKPMGQQSRLGVIGGDNAGFPNGRRPGDDVVDIELRVAMGILCTLNIQCTPAQAPSGGIHFTDGAYLDDSFFTNAFPYLKTPIPGSP